MNTLSTEDRRVRKTKRALREGLADLMLEKELRQITVRELTDRVDIHRATFYVHYKDIYDLYNQIEDAIFHELSAIILENDSILLNDFYKILFDYIIENKHISKMLFKSNENNGFLDRLTTLFKNISFEEWYKLYNISKADESMEFYIQYHLMGCLSIISRWVETDFKYPKEKLVEMVAGIDSNFDSFIRKTMKVASK